MRHTQWKQGQAGGRLSVRHISDRYFISMATRVSLRCLHCAWVASYF